jgi:hypothetical protein
VLEDKSDSEERPRGSFSMSRTAKSTLLKAEPSDTSPYARTDVGIAKKAVSARMKKHSAARRVQRSRGELTVRVRLAVSRGLQPCRFVGTHRTAELVDWSHE